MRAFIARVVAHGALVGKRLCLLAEHLQDMPPEMFLDLAVSWHGLRDLCRRILIPIMSAAMANEDTTQIFDLLDQIAVLHATSI
jgi:hypothetical protein